MAEGHSIVRWARSLSPMVGETIVHLDLPKRWAQYAGQILGESIARLETRGKHLLIHFSNRLTIHCHAMMYGSWQFGRPGMELRKPEKNVRLRLRTESREAVFYNGPVVEILGSEAIRVHPRLSKLGPDVLDPGFDRVEAGKRIRGEVGREVADVLLDQMVISGVGNIFKSESLFLSKIAPRRAAETLTDEEMSRLWHMLVTIMREASRESGPITTLPKNLVSQRERNWVYARSSRPCFLCQTPIVMIRQGDLKRTTFYCPKCQK